MRIVAMVEFFPPSLGSDLRIHELLGRLSDRHAISFVVIPAFRELVGRIPRPREDGPPQADVLRVRFGPMEWRVWRASPVLAVLLTMPLLLLRTLRLAGRLKPDVIVANTPSAYTGLLSFLVARIGGHAFVVDFNDLIAEYSASLMGWSDQSALARALRWVQTFITRKADHIFAVSDYVRSALADRGLPGDRVTVLRNGAVPMAVAARDGGGDRARCLYMGRLEAWAGLDLLEGLAKYAEAHHLPIDLRIAGPKPAEDGFLKGANVQYLGVFERSRLQEVLADVEYVLVPFPPTNFNEAAVPIKLMEGMAAGCVCVCSSRAGIKEVVAHLSNGVLVEDESPQRWADAILRLRQDPELRSRLGDRAQATIRERYTWDALAREFGKGLIEGRSRFVAAHGQRHHRRV